MKKINKVKLNSVHADLDQFDVLANKHDYIEVVEWHNGWGWDITINGKKEKRIALTCGQFNAIKKLIEELASESNF